jgi:peptide/nickel transport system substrate-binding protein
MGSYQVKVTTDGPDPVLLNRLSLLYIMDAQAKPGSSDAGTGPYIIKPGSTPKSQAIDLVAFNDWHGGHVYTRALQMAVVENTDQLTQDVLADKFDIAGTLSQAQLKQVKPVQSLDASTLGANWLGLNTERAGSPLNSLAGRQAVADALDLPKILQASQLQGEPANQLLPSVIPGYDPSIQSTPYNPAKAKQLLATLPDLATPLTLTYVVPSDRASGQEMIKELNAVGFHVTANETPSLGTLVTAGLGGQTDMFYAEYDTNTLDGMDTFNTLLSGSGAYTSSEFNSLAQKANSTLDQASRLATLKQISQLVHHDLPYIPLYYGVRPFAIQKPYVIQQDYPGAQLGIYFATVYQN